MRGRNVTDGQGRLVRGSMFRAALLIMPVALSALGSIAVASGTNSPQGSVITTVHNLSVSGPGVIRATSEVQVCKFCHVPHNALSQQPLWSQELSNAFYVVPTLRGRQGDLPAPQPDGASRLCLSCHDGTVALGELAGGHEPIRMAGSVRITQDRPGFIGTNLSGHHPISFVVTDDSKNAKTHGYSDMGQASLQSIRADPDVNLDGEGRMQCTTCHDPHSDSYYQPGRVPRFWVKPTIDEVCSTCHIPR